MKGDDTTAEVLRAVPLRILLVEDDEFDVAVFSRAFRQGGIPCEIVRCRSSEEALAGLRDAELAIDVLVADHQLPGKSGFDLCLELLDHAPPFALVLLTGGGSEQMAIRALRAGIQDYIVKDASQEYLDLLPLVLPRVARRHRERQARRAARSRAAPRSGATGLADLATAVRDRGGRIWLENAGAAPKLHFSVPLVESEVGAWAALEVVPGSAPEPPATAADRGGTRSEPGGSGAGFAGEGARRVLIAHPNSVVAHVASQAAEREGCRFVVLENGRKAVEALERERFDVVLMGVRMPGLDGPEATRRIRARERETGDRVTIVGLGVDREAGEAEECLEAGMDATIARPVDPVGLCVALAP